MSGETPDKRERGVLSEADRRYIADPEAYAEGRHRQSVREREQAIRQRLGDSILDLSYLFDQLPADIRRDVFAPDAPDADVLDGATADGIAFVYEAMREFWGHPREDRIEDAIRRVEEREYSDGYIVDVDVSITPRPVGGLAKEGAKKIHDGEEVSDAEVRAMLQQGAVDPEDVAAYLRGEEVDLPHWEALE